MLTYFISTCGLHVHEQFHPNRKKIQSSNNNNNNNNNNVLNQSLIITQRYPNRLSPMSRFTFLGFARAPWWLSRDLQASRASQENGAEETVFPPSLALLPKYLHNRAC